MAKMESNTHTHTVERFKRNKKTLIISVCFTGSVITLYERKGKDAETM